MPKEGELERVNLLIILHVTDPYGLEGTDYIRYVMDLKKMTLYSLSPENWQTAFGQMNAPVPSFTYLNGHLPLQAGQPVRFDAQGTNDPDNDRIDYEWDFGDGFSGTGDSLSILSRLI